MKLSTEALENKVIELWGPSVFDWQMGRSDEPAIWFWYCGQADPEIRPGWAHGGHAKTAVDAFLALIEAADTTHECERCSHLRKMRRLLDAEEETR